MSDALTRTEEMLRVFASTAIENERYFCELDAVVGDGDFGYSLARGAEELLTELDEATCADVSERLRKSAITITKRVGGTSGPLWGTGFLRAAVSLAGKPEPSPEDWVAALRAAADGIMERGRSGLGHKTLLDALVPATDRLEAELADGAPPATALERAAATARETAEATAEMVAQRGRASYAGDRSRGSVDAGAIAVATMFEAISAAFRDASSTATVEE
jgi:dihydroxyacetone kinase phosphoprotein-dependent L subunit